MRRWQNCARGIRADQRGLKQQPQQLNNRQKLQALLPPDLASPTARAGRKRGNETGVSYRLQNDLKLIQASAY